MKGCGYNWGEVIDTEDNREGDGRITSPSGQERR